jgi:ribonuclease P/MRP protein subunit POP5
VKSEVELSKDDMVAPIWDACIRFWGENASSNFNLWVMRHYFLGKKGEKNEAFFNYKTIVRCGRGYEEDVRAAFSTVTRYNRKRIAINTIGISGTVKSGIKKFVETDGFTVDKY